MCHTERSYKVCDWVWLVIWGFMKLRENTGYCTVVSNQFLVRE